MFTAYFINVGWVGTLVYALALIKCLLGCQTLGKLFYKNPIKLISSIMNLVNRKKAVQTNGGKLKLVKLVVVVVVFECR